jgi:zinc protease
MKSMFTAAAMLSAAALAGAAPPRRPASGSAEGVPVRDGVEGPRNGLQLHAIHYDSPGLIAYYTVVRTGSRNEVEAPHGLAHFFEHMMFRGTEKYRRTGTTRSSRRSAPIERVHVDDLTVYHLLAGRNRCRRSSTSSPTDSST